jgi:hypothetical protein
MSHDVFLSHSHADHHVATAICAHLEGRGLRCWIAPRDVRPGAVWAAELVNAIKASRALVVVWSKATNDSDQVLRELERAVHAGVPILPFRIEDAAPSDAVEYLLSATHWLDALTPPLERHIERLGDSLDALLARTPLRERREPLPPPPRRRRFVLAAAALAVAGLGVLAVTRPWRPDPGPPPQPAPARPPDPAPPPAPAERGTRFVKPWVEHDVRRDGRLGFLIHVGVVLEDREAKVTLLRATFETPSGAPLMDRDRNFGLASGAVAVQRSITAHESPHAFPDLELFLPYGELHVHEDQSEDVRTHDLLYRLRLVADESGETLLEHPVQRFEVTYRHPAEGWARFDRVWVTTGERKDGELGLVVHAALAVNRRLGKPTTVEAYVTFPDGEPLKDFDGRFASEGGSVAVRTTLEPMFDNALFDDVALFLPYAQLHMQPGRVESLGVVIDAMDAAGGPIVGRSALVPFDVDLR